MHQKISTVISTASLTLIVLLVSGCVSIGEPQLFSQSDNMAIKDPLYKHCDSDDSQEYPDQQSRLMLDPMDISLLNWNIYKGKRDNWDSDLHQFIEERDIVTIQEAHLSDRLKTVLHRHQFQWTLNAAFHLKKRPSGVMTASRVPVLDTCGMRHVEPLIRIPKTTLVSYYPISGHDQALLVANIHGINFTFGTWAYKKQVKQLFELVNLHDGPVIIAGDFNTWSRTRMRLITDQATSVGLESLDYSSHNRTHVFGNALDHVFFKGLIPVHHHSWHVLTSDHNPTRVHFKLL